jgi:hypothetical protein
LAFALPSNLSGTVHIRVTDTDRNNDATLDALAVDQLLIRTTTDADAALLLWLADDPTTTRRR